MNIQFEDLGVIDYKKAWDYQEEMLRSIVDSKIKRPDEKRNYKIILCEHPHVYTLGKSGNELNLLINDTFLSSINATYYKINRGGDITYHGPGQIVGYPIIDIEELNIGVKEYVFRLEEAIINTLQQYGISSSRLPNSIGVWLDPDKSGKSRKICAVGVRISKFVTMHGFALNVNTNLDYFSYINPCGIRDKGVTSLERELGYKPDIEEVKLKLKSELIRVFNFNEIAYL